LERITHVASRLHSTHLPLDVSRAAT